MGTSRLSSAFSSRMASAMFSWMASKPSSSAVRLRFKGKSEPTMMAAPAGETFTRRYTPWRRSKSRARFAAQESQRCASVMGCACWPKL